jgi:hypothetical protein
MTEREQAEQIIAEWERAEGESMREGHAETLIRLIEDALVAVRREQMEADCAKLCWACAEGDPSPGAFHSGECEVLRRAFQGGEKR